MHPSTPTDRRELRRRMRARRRAMHPAERALAAQRTAAHATQAGIIRPGTRIALFASMPDEPATAALRRLATARGAAIYFPRIDSARARRMSFAPAIGAWRRNRFGIAEPAGSARLPAIWLDIIFVPLVAFDKQGMRLGMGGGYYDRALAFRLRRSVWPGPTLIGVAYDEQELPHIAAAAHDVRLDAVLTQSGLRWFGSSRS